MGSKLLPRVHRVVEKAKERAKIDEALLSSADTKWKVDTSKLRFDERPPATQSLILQKDYREWMFSDLLDQLRPPKITPSDFVQLVDRVEKLSRTGLREPSGEQILALLEKYDVVVPKEVLISLLKDKGQAGVIRKKQYALTMRGTLAAPKPEAPPKWNLSCCKGLLEGSDQASRIRYKPSLYYNLSRMHHADNVRQPFVRSSAPAALELSVLSEFGGSNRDMLSATDWFLSQRSSPGAMPRLGLATPDPGGRQLTAGSQGSRSSGSPSNRRSWSRKPTRSRPATSFSSEKRDAPWVREVAPEPAHLCIDATNNTYTIGAYTPRQTKETIAQKPIHMQRFILNELGSKILMS